MTPVLELAPAPAVFGKFVWPMLWQSSLLVGVLYLLDSSLRRRLRPAVRYSLWLVLLVKLLLPPSLALPTGFAWWLRPSVAPVNTRRHTEVVVTYGPPTAAGLPASSASAPLQPPPPRLSVSGWALLLSGSVSVVLLGAMLVRWRQISRLANKACPADRALEGLVASALARSGLRRRVRLRLTRHAVSPALFGFFRPVILLPRSLAETLSTTQLQTVLLHELIHLRRRDIWVNALQALLQAAYWWHPLLWLANARIRRLREQAVDDAVMLALRDDAQTYAPTLLEVARLALKRPLPSLGLVGIFESKTALRERILRLHDFHPPRQAGLTFLSGLGLLAFALTALPMGSSPGQQSPIPAVVSDGEWPDPRFLGYSNLELRARFFLADDSSQQGILPVAGNYFGVLNSNLLSGLEERLRKAGAIEVPETGQVQFQSFSGGHFSWIIGGSGNNGINYQTRTVGARTIATGAKARFIATQPAWVPLELQVVPLVDEGSIRCQVALGPAFSPLLPQWSETVLPANGAFLWVRTDGMPAGKSQIVVLQNSPHLPGEPEQSAATPRPLPSHDDVKASHAPAASRRSNTLVQDGKLLFERGKLKEAEAALNQAIKEDPRNQAAYYYLNLIRETRDHELRSKTNDPARLMYRFLRLTNSLLHTSPGRQGINRKLDSIRLESISLDHLPLSKVVGILDDEVIRFDPEKQGINFTIINNNTGPGATVGVVDPSTGSPDTPPRASSDISQIPITIIPALTDIRLRDVLDAVVKVAERPVRYSIEDYGVVFSSKGTNEPPPLYIRYIKVDPNSFSNELAAAVGSSSLPRKLGDMQNAIRDYFAERGVNLEPPRTVFFNDRDDTLLIRGTLQDLDLVETLVSTLTLNLKPPQILIEARFFEVPRSSSIMLWHAPGIGGRVMGSQARVLTPDQARVFLTNIRSDPNNSQLSDQRVTTLSGRQSEMQVVDIKTIVMRIDQGALAPPGVPGSDVPYVTTNMAFGPILDIVPYIAKNGSDIEITATASLTEFLGYDKPDQWVPFYVGGKVVSGVKPLPHIRTRKITTLERMPVPNGHSVLLANPVDENGRPAEADGTIPKSLFVLITPTLVDPAGQPINR